MESESSQKLEVQGSNSDADSYRGDLQAHNEKILKIC